MSMDELDDIFEDNLDDGSIKNDNLEDDIDLGNLDLPADGVIEEPKSVLDELLALKGISDGKIRIVDENNEESTINFYDLTKEEQLNILHDVETNAEDPDLDDDEISLLNSIREQNISVTEYLELFKQSILKEAGIEETYSVDAYDDKELFALNLKQKYDLSDDELEKELTKELQDETLFKKKVDTIRKEYKDLEDQIKQTELQESEQKRQEEFDQFSQQMVDVAIANPEFYGIEIEDEDKNEVLSFLLDADETGVSQFQKTLNDPVKLYEAAWFLRYGKESFEALRNAYDLEILKLKNQNTNTSKVVKKTTKEDSIYDLF